LLDRRKILAELTSDVAERIRPVSGHLTETELVALATGMAKLELKYRGRASTTISERARPGISKII
jgi:hypothetical protein